VGQTSRSGAGLPDTSSLVTSHDDFQQILRPPSSVGIVRYVKRCRCEVLATRFQSLPPDASNPCSKRSRQTGYTTSDSAVRVGRFFARHYPICFRQQYTN
jgi:hypothetical protein